MKPENFPKESGIYCYENKKNKKKYIGLAVNLYNRIKIHENNFKKEVFEKTYGGENKHLWDSVKKYGRENFKLYVLELCERDVLEEKETFYIKELKSHVSENGYNVLWGGFSRLGVPISEENRKKLSEINSGAGNFWYGKTLPQYIRDAISKKNKGRPLSEEHKRKISENSPKTFLGKTHTPETREKISKANKGKKLSEEQIKKIIEVNTGRRNTPEQSLKISESRNKIGIKESGSSSKMFGVYFDKGWGKWRSQVSINNKQLNLGGFDSEIDAAKARDKYVYENNLPHRLNFPEDYPSRDGENNK